MKKLLFFVLLLILPVIVSARYTGEIIFKGEQIRIGSTNETLFIDNVEVTQFDGEIDVNNKYYIAKNNLLYSKFQKNGDVFEEYYVTVSSDAKVLCYDNRVEEATYDEDVLDKCDDFIKEGKYYKPGDILFVPENHATLSFYNFDGSLSFNLNWHYSLFFPELEGENVYWKFTEVSLNGYDVNSPCFKAITYNAPKFELECNPTSFYYGEKSDCSLYINSPYRLDSLSFDFKPEAFEVLGVELEKGIKKINGEREYNYEITDEYNQSETRRKLLTFKVAGTKNVHYEDEVLIKNIMYSDELVLGEYVDLDGELEILEYKEEKNPDTNNGPYVMALVSLAALTIFIYGFSELNKKRTKI